MFQSFIYLSKRLFKFWVNTYFVSHSFFVATGILDVSQFVKMLWFISLCYEILIVVLSFFLCCYFSLSPVSFACNFQDWRCVILREIDFLLKNLLIDSLLTPIVESTYLRFLSRNCTKRFKQEFFDTDSVQLKTFAYCFWQLSKMLTS